MNDKDKFIIHQLIKTIWGITGLIYFFALMLDLIKDDFIIFSGIIIILIPGIVFFIFDRKCSKCKCYFAMKKTGLKRKTEVTKYLEWKCKYCGYQEWRDI